MSTDVAGTNRSHWTSSYQLQHSDDTTRCPPSTSGPTPKPTTNIDRTSEPPLPSSSVAPTSAETAPAPTATALNSNTPTNINLTTANTNDVDSMYTCPHCDRTFTSHIGLAGHLRIPLAETGEPVPRAPAYTRCIRLRWPHYSRTLTHRMGLLVQIRIQESGCHRSLDTPSTFCTTTMPSRTHAPLPTAPTTSSSTTATISKTDTDTADFSCPHSPRTFTSHIGLVGHLRIHRTETGEPVPGAPTYTRSIRLNCPYCTRTFTRRLGLLRYMRIRENLRWTTAGHTITSSHTNT
ncbi:hypothetical protein SprV_0100324700 [Sparganum proliferum]